MGFAAADTGESPKRVSASVFISYAREDQEFVRRLAAALESSGHNAWVDWKDIEPSDRWMESIREAIDAAEAVLFIASPDSFASKTCRQEIEYAAGENKRLVPVVCRDVEHLEAPPSISGVNWVFLRPVDDFDEGVGKLERALELDLDLVRIHTRVLTRARTWELAGRRATPLRGEELRAAEDWVARAARGAEPQPTQLQTSFIAESKRIAGRRQRIAVAGALGVASVAIALATLALVQRGKARHEARVAQSRELATRAEGELGTDPEDAIRLAARGVRREATPQAVHALAHALDASRMRAQLRAQTPVEAAAFSTDGSELAAGGRDGSVRLWRVGQARPSWVSHGGITVTGVRFAPHGGVIAVARSSDRGCGVDIVDAATGAVRRTLAAGDSECDRQAEWVGATRTLGILGRTRSIELMNADTGRVRGRVGRVAPPEAAMYSMAIRPDGRAVAVSGGDEVVRVVAIRSGRRLATVHPALLKAKSLAFSPNGQQLALGEKGGAEIADLRDHVQFQLKGSFSAVNQVTWSADGGEVAGATNDPATYVWNAHSGRAASALHGSPEFFTAVAFSPRGDLATGSEDAVVRLWAPAPDKPLRLLRDPRLDVLVFLGGGAPGAHVSVFGTDEEVMLIDDRGRARGRLILPGHGGSVAVAAGGAVAVGGRGRIEVRRLPSGSPMRSWKVTAPGRPWPTSIALSSDARTTAAVMNADEFGDITSAQGRLSIASPTGTRTADTYPIRFVALSPDGTLAAVDDGAKTTVLRTRDLHPVHSLSGSVLGFTPSGRELAVQRRDTSIAMNETGTWAERLVLHSAPAQAQLGFSPDGRLVAGSGLVDGSLRVWDSADGTVLRRWQVLEQGALGGDRLTLSPPVVTSAGTVLVGGHDSAVHVFDACLRCLQAGPLLREADARLRAIRVR